jgi:hypothetical protein
MVSKLGLVKTAAANKRSNFAVLSLEELLTTAPRLP